jgi:hypothetical protein
LSGSGIGPEFKLQYHKKKEEEEKTSYRLGENI